MKKLVYLLLTLSFVAALVPSGMAAKKPAPSLEGVTEYSFVGGLNTFDSEGRLLAWQGTISGDIEGVIQWWMPVPKATGQASHYDDRWVILESDAVDAEVLMAGDESGSTTVRHGKNSIWRTNGTVMEVSEEFEDWIGCQVHCDGTFTWQVIETPDGPITIPDSGTGTFRAN